MPVQSETFRGQDLTTMEIQMHQELKKRAAERSNAHPSPQSSRNLHVETHGRPSYVDVETQYEPQVTPELVQPEGSLHHRKEEILHVEDEPRYILVSLQCTLV